MNELPLAFVIEDQINLAILFSQALSTAGYRVKTFRDGPSALKDIQIETPQFILLDLQLPLMDGEAIIDQLDQFAELKLCRVVLCTANSRMAEQLEMRVDGILLKPVLYNQLRKLAIRFREDFGRRQAQLMKFEEEKHQDESI